MSKTVDELIGAYIEASNAVVWEADRLGHLPKTLDMQRAGIRAVVTALRDEMQVHCHTHGEPECCGRGVPNYNNTAEECCCAPNMKVTDEIVIGLFNEILAPREGGSREAGGSTSNAGTATEAGGARCATTCASAPAAPAPVCVWTASPVSGLFSARCQPHNAFVRPVDNCHLCGLPIKFTEAQR